MTRKLIGTGITDENGEATITYTGTGAGRLNIVAESGTFVSVPCNVWDTLFYDDGVTNPKTASWQYPQSSYTGVSINTTNGTTIANQYTGDNNPIYAYFNGGNTFNYPIAVEFDCVAFTTRGVCGIDLYKDGVHRWNFNELDINQNDSVKLIYDGNTIKVYKNGSSSVHRTINQSALSNFKFGFYLRVGQETFTFKDLKVYSI